MKDTQKSIPTYDKDKEFLQEHPYFNKVLRSDEALRVFMARSIGTVFLLLVSALAILFIGWVCGVIPFSVVQQIAYLFGPTLFIFFLAFRYFFPILGHKIRRAVLFLARHIF